jgi:molybdate transport system substrate-binding protein
MRKPAPGAAVLAAALFLPLAAHSAEPVQLDAIFPPRQHGENNDATQRGLSFSVPQVDDLADFHGNVSDPKLVLYVGGNYFFAMAPLSKEAFDAYHD